MPTFLSDLLRQAKSIWLRLDGGQRATIVTVLLATAIGLGALVWYAGQPDYHNVHTATDQEGWKDTTNALEKGGVPWKAEGLTVSVPSSEYDRARSVLINAGINSGSSGGALIGPLGKTGAEVKEYLWRTRVADVERSIAEVRGIRTARIPAFKPRKRLFQQDAEKSKAVVLITLKNGADFHQVGRMALEAAASGLGILREYVVVYDADSGDRHAFDHRGGSADGGGFIRHQQEREFLLEAKAHRALMKAYQGEVVVVVNLELDPKSVYKEGVNLPEEGLTPNLVETTTKDSTVGVPGPRGSPSGAPAASGSTPATATNSRSNKTSDKINKKETDPTLYGKQIQRDLVPAVERKTISVTINTAILENAQDDDEKTRVQKMVEDLVKQAVGFKEVREDKISTAFVKFADVPPPAEEPGPDLLAAAKSFAPAIGQVLAVLLVIFFLKGMMKKARPKPAESQAVADHTESEEDLAPEEVARRMRREIEQAINEDPAAISQMLDNWLTEQKA